MVALLAEGVDRNSAPRHARNAAPVALLAEGVDRNISMDVPQPLRLTSPSSRRAWIEIQVANLPSFGQLVALLAEGVDRNGL